MTPAGLRAWRCRMGLSQAAAAEALGLSARAYRYHEAGKRDGKPLAVPRWLALACAAIALNVTQQQLDMLLAP